MHRTSCGPPETEDVRWANEETELRSRAVAGTASIGSVGGRVIDGR